MITTMLGAAIGIAASGRGPDAVRLEGREIRLVDIVPIRQLPKELATRVIARIAANSPGVTLTRDALVSLVTRRAPGLAPTVLASVTARAFIAGVPPRRGCFVLRKPIGKGQAIAADAIAVGACGGSISRRSVTFDRINRVAQAAADLPVGSAIAAFPLAPVDIAKGGSLRLISTEGPVRVIRPVIAMQAAKHGRKLFVRDEDGQVFAVRVAEAARP